MHSADLSGPAAVTIRRRGRVAAEGRRVVVVAYDGMSVFETGIVTEVFGLERPEFDLRWYDLRICAERNPVRLVGGAELSAAHGLAEIAHAHTVIVPGVPDVHGDPSPELVAALRTAYQRGARIVSICSGAFALAAAGLLDNRPATTHWQYAPLLRQRFPLVRVDADVLYVDDGNVLTSAGSAAGVDLCLHLVRQDFGPSVANAVARRMVVPPHRDGGQAQYVESPVPDELDDDRIAASMAWALAHLEEDLTVSALAAQAHMSRRSYLRHFQRCTGTSPIRWLIVQRVQASLPLLERGDAPVEQVAATVGFATAVTFRHHFAKTMRTSPSAYRRAFRTAARADG
ncbi:AraC family transcriptional regulator, transcriptional activator FtrA [Actinopolymorpha cephalotaxi]|uniref:AraC family transcriptional activator FtrA n=1 Tax=Actinopolymorpha cephalotaxi TaxID=504797 RepID=A0A1I2VYE3_9ACTN|nr:helix-turn-helix domain-containing protein [Actinopolymorpha cephalotaxi]NYH82841.1 AraC family transcriptional activator FtrA [Actinopolymorpha cephalotaxi]SFG94160.1 AraC family transcriptional regulator, transcriptional activator FtrA [Actinopolymorpha cephalotaxi]